MRRVLVPLALALACGADGGTAATEATTGGSTAQTDSGLAGSTSATSSDSRSGSDTGSTSQAGSESSSATETTGGTTTGDPVDPIEPWPALRGALHVHSPFSHDACDGEGLTDGVPNQACLQDLRTAICDTGYDFTLLTDHPSFMQGYAFEELLLQQPGDVLEMEAGAPVANHISCGDGHEAVIAVGYESTHVMPLGLRRHVDPEFYAGLTDAEPLAEATELVAALQAAGAVVSIAHSEEDDLSAARLVEVGVDSMEWYNPHGNFVTVLGGDLITGDVTVVLDLLSGMLPFMAGSDAGAHPDLVYLRLLSQWPVEGFTKWREVLRARPVTGVLGSDVHQNVGVDPICALDNPLLQAACVLAAEAALPPALAGLVSGGTLTMADGDRLDSYDRIFRWLENRVLVEPDRPVDLAAIQDGLRQGRSYGLFSVFGDPVDFGFVAQVDSQTFQIGERLAPPFTLIVQAPTRPAPLTAAGPQWNDEEAESATVRTILVRTSATGSETVAQFDGLATRLEYDVTAEGAYHVEVWLQPGHLLGELGDESALAAAEYLWLITNPIHAGA